MDQQIVRDPVFQDEDLVSVLFTVGIGEFVFDGAVRDMCSYVSIWGHMQSFSKGVVFGTPAASQTEPTNSRSSSQG